MTRWSGSGSASQPKEFGVEGMQALLSAGSDRPRRSASSGRGASTKPAEPRALRGARTIQRAVQLERRKSGSARASAGVPEAVRRAPSASSSGDTPGRCARRRDSERRSVERLAARVRPARPGPARAGSGRSGRRHRGGGSVTGRMGTWKPAGAGSPRPWPRRRRSWRRASAAGAARRPRRAVAAPWGGRRHRQASRPPQSWPTTAALVSPGRADQPGGVTRQRNQVVTAGRLVAVAVSTQIDGCGASRRRTATPTGGARTTRTRETVQEQEQRPSPASTTWKQVPRRSRSMLPRRVDQGDRSSSAIRPPFSPARSGESFAARPARRHSRPVCRRSRYLVETRQVGAERSRRVRRTPLILFIRHNPTPTSATASST